MKETKYSQWLTVLLVLISSIVFSQTSIAKDIPAFASVNQTTLSTNEVFNFKVVYMGTASRDDFDASVLNKDFTTGQVQYGTSRYSINGDTTIRTEWNVSLATNKTGNVVIPSFTVNGAKTQPISLHVSKDPSTPNQDDLIEFQDSISKHTLYPKEMATLRTRLVVKADPRGLQNTKIVPPTGDGLSITPIGEPKQYQKLVNGIEATVVDQNYQVTATEDGKYTLHPPRLTATLIDVSRATGARRIVPVNVYSGDIELTVLEKPASFSGVWLPTQSLKLQQGWQNSDGDIMDVSSGEIDAKVGQPITRILALVVKDVSAENLPELKIDYPTSVRVYAEKPKFGQDKQGNTVMTLKQVLMPKKPGSINLPAVNVPWWNSKTNKEETATTKGLTLATTVDENAPVQTPVITPTSTNSAITMDDKTTPPTDTLSTPTMATAGYWPYLTALFAVLWLLTLILLIRKHKQKPDTEITQPPMKADNNDLVSVLKNQDGAKIHGEISQWLTKHPDLSSELTQAIKAELSEVMAAFYSKKRRDYDTKPLLDLLKKAEREVKKKNKSDDNDMPQL
ncbi:protein BatD [Vibrio sp. S17_S38]|uniref:BatD family protein n=1 Tax=Vibrio sp. S17_S38 TaxID=2720229 RepID=UPI0016814E1E|nr:BatD family protein [Vibrio sp. S17_S38]MBD1573563.1 protein BatD [Vibrio sp. S17_S38]